MKNEADMPGQAEYFEALFNKAKQNCLLVLEPDGIISDINDAFILSFGYKRAELIGKYFGHLFTTEDQEKGLPEQELRIVLSEGRSSDNNYLVNCDNTITWVSGESVRVSNAKGKHKVLKAIQNIHQQKVTESELRMLNDLNEDILGSIQDVVLVLDKNMNLVKTNNSFEKLFCEDDTVIPSINFQDYFNSFDANNIVTTNAEHALKFQKSIRVDEIEIITPQGEKKIFNLNCIPIQDSLKQNVTIVLHDITLYKQIEREREDIIGFVAHELRNPLANVILANEIMTEAINENKISDALDMLQRSKNNVMRLNKMIAELYDATKAKSGNFNLEITTINFDSMIREAIDTVQVLQPAYHIVVKGDTNIEVKGDKYRLTQVITNYLGNGIKYSQGKNEVTLSVEASEESVTVAVKDEGLGIPQQQLPHIFDKFFRSEKTRNIEGVGLGLYLSRQIIEAHKGQVWVESIEGKGSTFYFSIPRVS